jgi:hypothetical protein
MTLLHSPIQHISSPMPSVCRSTHSEIGNSDPNQRPTFRAQKKTSGKAGLSDRPPSREGIHRACGDPQTQLTPYDTPRVARASPTSIWSVRRQRRHRHAVLHYGVSRGPHIHRHVDARRISESPARVVRNITPNVNDSHWTTGTAAGSPPYVRSARYPRSTLSKSASRHSALKSRTSHAR